MQQGALGQAELASWGEQLSTMPQPSRIIIANVAGAAVEQALRGLSASWAAPVEWLVASAERAGVSNRYNQPARLGGGRRELQRPVDEAQAERGRPDLGAARAAVLWVGRRVDGRGVGGRA